MQCVSSVQQNRRNIYMKSKKYIQSYMKNAINCINAVTRQQNRRRQQPTHHQPKKIEKPKQNTQ